MAAWRMRYAARVTLQPWGGFESRWGSSKYGAMPERWWRGSNELAALAAAAALESTSDKRATDCILNEGCCEGAVPEQRSASARL
jgi:hypothetical protein